jgi:threonine/homoserine/homoserine lactone efflux protein
MSVESWLLFSSIALVATLSPGPAILLVSSHSVSYGLKNSVATMLGNISGLFVMSALSVLGLSAIILHSAALFVVLKFAGAAYLIYLGLKLLRKGFSDAVPARQSGDGCEAAPSYSQLYSCGLLVALSNPKAVAFTTALFPQFVDRAQPVVPQFGILLVTFMALSFSCLYGYARMADMGKGKVREMRLSAVVSRAFGLMFIVSGLLLANASREPT